MLTLQQWIAVSSFHAYSCIVIIKQHKGVNSKYTFSQYMMARDISVRFVARNIHQKGIFNHTRNLLIKQKEIQQNICSFMKIVRGIIENIPIRRYYMMDKHSINAINVWENFRKQIKDSMQSIWIIVDALVRFVAKHTNVNRLCKDVKLLILIHIDIFVPGVAKDSCAIKGWEDMSESTQGKLHTNAMSVVKGSSNHVN